MAIRLRRKNKKERGMKYLKATEDESEDQFEPAWDNIKDGWTTDINEDIKDLMKDMKSANVIDDLQTDELEPINNIKETLPVCVSLSPEERMQGSVACALSSLMTSTIGIPSLKRTVL